jgi:hypothetical protein
MRIAFTSDVHADVTRRNGQLLPLLARAVDALAPDVFVLAGDTANTLPALDEALAAFEAVPARKLLVPGNHDVWIDSRNALRRGRDSWHKYLTGIPEVCARRGFHDLVGAPLVLGDVGFAGSLGWYDYSLRDLRLESVFRPVDYERGEFLDESGLLAIWNDARSAVWLRDPHAADWRLRSRRLSNADVFARIRTLFEQDLQRLAAARAIVAVLHTGPFAECLTRKPQPDPFDAYEGSLALGELLARAAARGPVTCICGHRHRPLDVSVQGVRVVRSPVGYLDDVPGSLEEVAAGAVGLVEVPEGVAGAH